MSIFFDVNCRTAHRAQIKPGTPKNDLADEYQDYNLVVAQNNGRPYETRQIDRKLKTSTLTLISALSFFILYVIAVPAYRTTLVTQ